MMRAFTKLLAIFIIVGGFAGAWLIMEYNAFLNRAMVSGEQAQAFEITPGSSVKTIARQLERAGYISNALYFEGLVRLSNQGGDVQAGEYQIDPGMTPEAFLNRITSGEVVQYAFTIIEGWSFKQLLQELAQHKQIVHTLEGKNEQEIIAELNLDGAHPEGWFLPDTYHFPQNTTDVDFLNRSLNAMRQALDVAWAQRQPNLPIKTPYEALILASIVEKETGLASERPHIAGVFTRRLIKRMRLQTDPTVIYGMGDAFDGNIRRADLRRDTPYNTYTRHGLPPTPIALPSLDAIEAVLNPEPGKTLYFVSRGDGSHYFSVTLDEHNRAVRKYQLKR